jgi:hypothetical protein
MFIGEFMCWVVYAAVQSFIPQRRTSCDDEATQPLLHESAGQSASSSSYDSDADDASDVGSVTAIKEPVLAVEDHELEPSRHATSKPVMSGWAMLWMWIPACCDITATTSMNVGLMVVAPSIYQMLRGSV